MAHFMTSIVRYVYLGIGVIMGEHHQECENIFVVTCSITHRVSR